MSNLSKSYINNMTNIDVFHKSLVGRILSLSFEVLCKQFTGNSLLQCRRLCRPIMRLIHSCTSVISLCYSGPNLPLKSILYDIEVIIMWKHFEQFGELNSMKFT